MLSKPKKELLLRHPANSTLRESLENIWRYSRNLEIIALACDAEAHVLKPVGQPNAEGRLKVGGIPLKLAELAGFPAPFLLVPGGIESKDMGVQLRIGQGHAAPAGPEPVRR